MRKMIIFEKYELNENGEVRNINTGNTLKVETKNDIMYVKLSIEGKSKRINITSIMEENFPPIVEEKEKLPIERKNYNSRKYVIKITELDGTVREFKSFKKANDFYGLRKDYLNYCLTEPFFHMLTKNGLNLKSVERVNIK